MRAWCLAAAALALAAGGWAQSAPPPPPTVNFSGRTWLVRSSARPEPPGGNLFDRRCVSLEKDGALRLSVAKIGNSWRSAEVELPASLGYGTYEFLLDGRVDLLDPVVVLGLFTFSDSPGYANREIDIEFSQWSGKLVAANAQYAVQPAHLNGGLERFAVAQSGEYTLHRFVWEPGRIRFESLHGHEGGVPIRSWTYAGANVPPPGDERVHMNLYLDGGKPPSNGTGCSVRITEFRFFPAK
jgi:hypothetical protein